MADNYFADLSKISIDKFKSILKTKDILPGRIILKEKLDERFELLKENGISSLANLLDTLKTKVRLIEFTKQTGLSEDYITMLKREANSYISSPVKLDKFINIDRTVIEKLSAVGINNSKQFFTIATTTEKRQKLATELTVSVKSLDTLISLCDLVRITGVGPIFAIIVCETGYTSIEKFLDEDTDILLENLRKTNDSFKLTKVKFAEKDIEYCKVFARELDQIIDL